MGEHIISFLDICAMQGQLVLAEAPSIPAINDKMVCTVLALASTAMTAISSSTGKSTAKFTLLTEPSSYIGIEK